MFSCINNLRTIDYAESEYAARFAQVVKPQIGDHIAAGDKLVKSAITTALSDARFQTWDAGEQQKTLKQISDSVHRASADRQIGGGHIAALHAEYVKRSRNSRIVDRVAMLEQARATIRQSASGAKAAKPVIKELKAQQTYLEAQIRFEKPVKELKSFLSSAVRISIDGKQSELRARAAARPARAVCRVSRGASEEEVIQALAAIPPDIRRNARIVSA